MAELTIKTRYKQNTQIVTVVFIEDENAAVAMTQTLFEFEKAMNAHSDTRFHLELALGVKRATRSPGQNRGEKPK